MGDSVARVCVRWCRDQVVASARNAPRCKLTDSTRRRGFNVRAPQARDANYNPNRCLILVSIGFGTS
jgi:hypothetical protein